MPEENKPESGEQEEQEAVLSGRATEERLALYDSMKEQKEQEAEPSPEEEESVTEEETKTETEPSPEEEETGETEKEESEKEKKTVPLGALHESRAETREAKEQIRQLQTQMAEIVGDYRKVVEAQAKPKEPEVNLDAMTDSEREIYELKQEVKALSENQNTQNRHQQQYTRDQFVENINRQVKTTDVELEKEGYPGFAQFENQVAKQLKAEGASQEALGNPEEWKRVFKKTVFPSYQKLFTANAREKRFAEKERLKAAAGLIKTPGKTKKAPPKENENTYNDYLEVRAKGQVL